MNSFIVGTQYYISINGSFSSTEMIDKYNNTRLRFTGAGKYRYIRNGISSGWINTPSGTAWWEFEWSGTVGLYVRYYDSSNNVISWDLLSNSITKLELMGIFRSLVNLSNVPYAVDSIQYQAYRKYAIANPIEIELDKMNCEPHLVSKTTGTNLLYVDTAYGAFREEQDVLTPSIVIEYSKIPDFNYVYIPSLSRYYFVKGITLVRYGVYRIDLKVDVLCTYGSDIRTQNAFVLRNENTYDSDIFDDRYPTKTQMSYNIYNASAYRTTTNNCENVSFSQNTNSGYRWVLSSLSGLRLTTTHDVTAPVYSGLTDVAGVYPANVGGGTGTQLTYYALNEQKASYFINGIETNQALASYIMSFVYYPFDVTSIFDSTLTDEMVAVNEKFLITDNSGSFVSTIPADLTKLVYGKNVPNMNYLIIADFEYKITTPTYKHFEPYRYYELWIPFVGWIKIKAKDFVNRRLLVYYAVDIGSGMATAYVKNYYANAPLFSASCQLGVRLPVTTTNEEQLTRQKQNNVLNLAIGMVGSGVSTAIGVATENPVAVVGGILSATKSIASYVNANNVLFETAQTSLFSSETSLFSEIASVRIKVTQRNVVDNFNASDYGHTQGYPLHSYMSLSSLTGYTEIPEMHYKPSSQTYITKTEIDEIISLARDGIIL